MVFLGLNQGPQYGRHRRNHGAMAAFILHQFTFDAVDVRLDALSNEPARWWIEHYRVRCKKWDFCVYHLLDWKSMSILTQFRYFLKKIGHSRPLLTLFSSFQYCYSKKMFIINFAYDWIWTADLWCWEPLYQLSHKLWHVFKTSLVKNMSYCLRLNQYVVKLSELLVRQIQVNCFSVIQLEIQFSIFLLILLLLSSKMVNYPF